MILLSVCIPTRDRPEALLKTVGAVEDQITRLKARDEIEIIVSDNTDDDRRRVDPAVFAGGLVRYSRNEGNIGYARNINKVIDLARGEYVWLLSDDDLLEDAAVAEILKAVREGREEGLNYLTFYTGARHRDTADDPNMYFKNADTFYFVNGADFLARYWRSAVFISGNVFHRRRLADYARDHGLFDEVSDTFQNSLLCIGFIVRYGHVRIIPETLLTDSYEDEFYTPDHAVKVTVTDFVAWMARLRRLGVSGRALAGLRGVWNGFKGVGTKAAMVANCATQPHAPDEIVREDPFTDKIPYKWEIRHG